MDKDEAFEICVRALENLTVNENIYADDGTGRSISFEELESMIKDDNGINDVNREKPIKYSGWSKILPILT